MSKRRKGGRPAPPRRHGGPSTAPVRAAPPRSRLPVLPLAALAGALVVVVVVGFVLLRPGGSGGTAGASASPSAAASASAGAVVSQGPCPTSQPAPLAAGQTRTVTLATAKGSMVVKVQADLSPIAAGNFVALAACGFYDGTIFHRTAKLPDGTPFVIQGGGFTADGKERKTGYTIQDEPVTTPYKRGTVAMARSNSPNSVTSQFFIVLDDKDADVLSQYNTYQIIGDVTSGMDVADAIYKASGGVETPANPIPITTATVTNP